MICSNCATENPSEARFCLRCGQSLTRSCTNCGTSLPPSARFCFSCGSAIDWSLEPASAITADEAVSGVSDGLSFPRGSPPSTQLRQVSVLFCDLVDFTTLSESQDPEEVRELLSGYFELARSVISRYGGTVEKFIGDAVMAVWGAPVAKEDDAERAVRSALDLASAISAYGDERGVPVAARIGVATGPAATATPEEGIVIGDRVNTAARIQSVAPPRSCFVDDATKNASSAAIAYRDAGEFELKGKTELVHLNEAMRVVAGVRGSLKSSRLEAPFVGRDGEFRLVKELLHTAAGQNRALLVSIVGVAGIGKSRLAWEFFKYIDGLADPYFWHLGRCLAYGDGVTYWALAEMVRSRAGIVEAEDPSSAAAKLHAAVETYVSDVDERRWVEARLAQLLGLEPRTSSDREDLFAGWRLFFERMAEINPVV
ncbi:MAG TPA: adenylate/guanylate cyclase domain-containing protein, partial [Acidimicrobiales bacterium]|nr:adenylate/guanylate cyclase domain-containing protein [Acidimicrobiales bacterium]